MTGILKTLKILGNTVIVALVVLAGLFAAGHFNLIPFFKPFVVLSGSMEPSISTGSVALVLPRQFGYMEGDVITFMTSEDGPPTTHRVIEIQAQGTDLRYQTQGDANKTPDNGLVDPRNVIGRVVFSIPLLGYLANFAGQPVGFVALIIIPATLIIYEELKTMRKEMVRLFTKKQGKQDTSHEPIVEREEMRYPARGGHSQKQETRNILESITDQASLSDSQTARPADSKRKIFNLFGVMVIIAMFGQVTQAKYSDQAISVDNFFGAAASFAPELGGIELPEECTQLSGVITEVIEGTPDRDRLRGTEASELILGYEGDDRIDGGGGSDCIVGGPGDDQIDGDSGDDILLGQAGEDEIDGGTGNDTIYGGDGDDELDGDAGNDEIFAGLGNDELEGKDGQDILRGDEGDDRIEAGSGDDDLRGGPGDDELEGGSGNDILSGGPGDDQLDGGSGDDSCLSGEDLDSCEF